MTKSGQPGPTLRQATLHPGGIAPPNRTSLPGFVSIVLVAAVIYGARDVFLPISVAMLIAFALSPMVLAVWRRGVPQLFSVLIVATDAFAAMALFFLVVAGQMSTLAQNLPTFQANILAKVDSFQAASGWPVSPGPCWTRLRRSCRTNSTPYRQTTAKRPSRRALKWPVSVGAAISTMLPPKCWRRP